MNNWNNVSFNPQGWQCPVCGAVYSPMTPACFNCTGWKVSNRNDTKSGDAIFDWIINESVTKSEKPEEGR